MRLIDADELKIDYGFTWSDITPTHDELYELINRQPTIDAVPVVRCGECRYGYVEDDGYMMCGNADGYDPVEPNGYCAWGERKDGDWDGGD